MYHLITYKEALNISLAKTSEGMFFKGQYLPKRCYNILGEEVELITKAFRNVYLIKFENEDYFISEDLIKKC